MFQCPNVILIVIVGYFAVSGNVIRNEDICGPHNGRRLYLELGEQGVLYAKNISFVKNAPRQQVSRVYVTNSSHDQCSLELVTCPSCVITVTFKNLALSHHCGDGGVMMDSPCRCDYVWISEPPYEDVSGTPFCGLYAPITYRSNTRTLSIALLYSQSHSHAFTLEYTAERNRLHLRGADMITRSTTTMNNTGGGILTSPFFPARYPRDLGMEYIITCPSEAPSCRVRVLFSDFQLATVSIMEFYDWNGQRLDVSSGARFRPPVIVSSGPSLLIRFYANGGTGLGYKAFYSFVIGHLYDKSIQPITDCGGYVENLGGAITMLDMVGQGVKTYDCVWLIRPPKNFLHMKTHMYLKVVTFADMAGNTELTIKQGPTSALLPLEILRHPASQLQPPRFREHVAPVASGFHVSLRGTFGPTSRLAIAYAAFSYMDCFTGSDFLCQNHRCIPSQLNCDGFDHCDDNSDEPASCFRDWNVEPQDRKWHMNKANYYFPKIDRYPDLKTATLVFVASSLGLIVLISALIILLYRMGARARQQRELQSRLQTISELLVFDIADGARIDEITVSDDPPVYEAPPGYDEVVKISMESEDGRGKRRSSPCPESRSRSSPSPCSASSTSGNDFEPQPSTLLIVESASANRSSQTTPVQHECRQPVPESPPPPYVTPPGTISRNLQISGLTSLSLPGNGVINISKQGTRARRAWLRSCSEMSRSPLNADAPPPGGPSSSMDAEALGAYLKAYTSNSTEPSAPQSNNLDDVSRDINSKYKVEPGGSPEPGTPGCLDEDDKLNCNCEGACGCANDNTYESIGEVNERSSAKPRYNENEPLCPKSAIIKLLGSSRNTKSPQSTNLNSTTVSTSSTPYGTLGRSIGRHCSRKLSICSKDSCITKISTVSSSNSYEKLQDNFEIVSEAASVLGTTNPGTMVNTPNGTPKARARRSHDAENYSNCDMDSLYENIKVLDSFLARQGMSVVHNRNHSMAVMLFGTPEHSGRRTPNPNFTNRNEAPRCSSRSRIWRSSDDTCAD
ncbi:uncharacterized protein LOC107272410 isoform X4 [Cephus cinctus]|uniref:Uncharacterized protein LOC107272410 isoform X4 n=1 Tax=Cephus cinctus TaxID=211228 RepID=A0AAJ7RRB2_CEPCN|nr:uncharacterized protein LOC107272410 isoform X4 [Cephus cinctus]